jgi:SAM-dependent methyltransferase
MQKLLVNENNKKAVDYVGTFPEEGVVQLEALKLIGLLTSSYVLEIGCGALIASVPIIDFVEKDHYVGIEPNKWLVDDSLSVIGKLDKCPKFLHNESFDSKELNMKFDFIISHSVMSHAAEWQLVLFLKNCYDALNDGGKLLFSIRFYDGKKEDTDINAMDDKWHYPDSVYISRKQFKEHIKKYFTKTEEREDITKMILDSHPLARHDWVLATK